jgi:hypothetical protein
MLLSSGKCGVAQDRSWDQQARRAKGTIKRYPIYENCSDLLILAVFPV